jgi:hypothetical protein
MPIDDDKLYDQLGRAWIHYALWRERIFAGYLSVLAALGYAFSKDTSIPVRTSVFGFAILISAVFRILDYRTTDLVNLVQRAGESLAGSKGLHREIEVGRFGTEGRASYGLAIDTLVAGVTGTSAAGLFCMLMLWRNNDGARWWWSIVAVVLAFVFWVCLRKYTRKLWLDEQAKHKARGSRAGHTSG